MKMTKNCLSIKKFKAHEKSCKRKVNKLLRRNEVLMRHLILSVKNQRYYLNIRSKEIKDRNSYKNRIIRIDSLVNYYQKKANFRFLQTGKKGQSLFLVRLTKEHYLKLMRILRKDYRDGNNKIILDNKKQLLYTDYTVNDTVNKEKGEHDDKPNDKPVEPGSNGLHNRAA